MRLMILGLIAVLMLGSCKPKPESPYPGAENFGPQLIQSARATCEKTGGRFGPGGKGGSFVCFTTPRDAGKMCSAASECSTQCLARSRSCAPISPLRGCNDVLADDGTRTTLCVD